MSTDDSKTNGDSNGVTVNSKAFWARLTSLYDQWRKGGKSWGASGNAGGTAADALIVIYGKSDDDDEYSKTKALQVLLFGYEADDTTLVFCKDTLYILTGQKKATMLSQLGTDAPNASGLHLTILASNKADGNAANIETLITKLMASNGGRKLGVLGTSFETPSATAERATKTSKALLSALQKANFEAVDVTTGIAGWMSIKDKAGIEAITIAASHTTNVIKRFLLPRIEELLDEGKSEKHSALADATEDIIRDPAKVKTTNASADDLETCYTPIIQSGWGDTFDLKPSAQSNDEQLTTEDGVIIVSIGSRYKDWCSNLARTYFVNPTDEMKDTYGLVAAIFLECKKQLRAGNKVSAVYESAKKIIEKRNPALLAHFTKNCGCGIGLEFRESALILNDKNQRTLQKNMVFNLTLGFDKLKTRTVDKATGQKVERTYAVLLSDTVLVDETEGKTLTHAVRDWTEVAYFLGDENEEEEKQPEFTTGPTTRRERAMADQQSDDAEAQRRTHQADLARKQREAALRLLASDNIGSEFNKSGGKSGEGKTISYRDVKDYPATLKPHTIFVDTPAETVFLPIADQLVPFHISTVKNIYKAENGDNTYLSLQFHTPELTPGQIENRQKIIRELTFRGKLNGSLDKAFFDVKELRKRVQDRVKEYEATKDIVVQEELRVTKVGTVPALKDVMCRPQLSRKKVMTGTLTAHINGFRYVTFDKVKVDIIYSNIKHAFYQPADKTPAVLLHFELKNPIMLDANAKQKKTHFLQFFVDVVEASEDISITSRSRDYDGLDEERREREMRKKHNERFLVFVKQVEDQLNKQPSDGTKKQAVHLEFDIPYSELQFKGVPGKQVVTMLPTVHALVALDDIPPVVITLSDIEIANFERVSFGLRDFDLVIVWKDFKREPVRIDNIPMTHLKDIKDWLNSCDILYYESPMALMWKNIMKNINEDLESFWQEGGFEFLNMDAADADAEEGEEGGPKEESGSEFEMDSDDSAEEDDDDSDDSEVSEDDSDSDADVGSDEESGEDWDELDKKAMQSDKAKAQNRKEKGRAEEDDLDSDDDDRPKAKSSKKR